MDIGDLKNVNEKILRRKTEISDLLTKKYKDNSISDSVDIKVVERDMDDEEFDRNFAKTLTESKEYYFLFFPFPDSLSLSFL